MYPTMEQVEAADRHTLCSWYRFLPSPGSAAIGGPMNEFRVLMARQKPVLDRIVERFTEAGGFTPEISKQLG